MTPKEKAEELYLQMLTWQDHADIYIDRKIISISAKQCALIAVDEIIQAMDNVMLPNPFKQYWNKVKQEIQAL